MPVAAPRNGRLKRAGAQARAKRARERAWTPDMMQGTLDSLPAHIAVIDAHGEILMTNRAWASFGEANDACDPDTIGSNYLGACDAADGDEYAAKVAVGLRQMLAGERNEFRLEYPCHSPEEQRWFLVRASRYEGAGPAQAVVAHDNITLRKEAQAEVREQAGLIDELDVAVVAMDGEGLITEWNRGAERMFGWSRDEAIGESSVSLIGGDEPGAAEDVIAAVGREGSWHGRLTLRRRDNSTFPADSRLRTRTDEQGRPAGGVAVSVDITEAVESERALLAAQNYTRAVTDSMGEGLFTLDSEGKLVYMNKAAEAILGWPAEQLQGREMHNMTHRLRPDGSELPVGECSIRRAHREGVTVYVEDDVFIRRDGRTFPVAYTAAPIATDDGLEGCAVVFTDISERKEREELLGRDAEKLSWIGRIRSALTQDRFLLYAQPIIEVATGKVVQRELLLRMREPDGEVVSPGYFISVAEEYGLTSEIDRWVIEHAIEIAAAGAPVQLNLSAHSVGDPMIFRKIESCLKRTGADPGALVFEITETALIADEAAARSFAQELHGLGCKLALDDFGTGYGGFTYLKALPVDYLKIDIEFVRDLASNPASRHVVEAVVALARAFKLKTVGEGVEDAVTLELLGELGVDFAQGYHIARPAPLAEPVLPAASAEGLGDLITTHERGSS